MMNIRISHHITMDFTKKILVVFAFTIMLGISSVHCRPSFKPIPCKILFIMFLLLVILICFLSLSVLNFWYLFV